MKHTLVTQPPLDMYMYSIMQACERDGSALTDTDYTSMDNSKVILCCDLIDGNDVMKSPHRLHQTLVLQTFSAMRFNSQKGFPHCRSIPEGVWTHPSM